MICSFCSLLCDEDDLKEISCSKRKRALVNIATTRAATGPSKTSDSSTFVRTIHESRRVLITGRITSVQTARAAVTLGAKLDATIDCAWQGHAFKNIAAIQRFGMNSVSIGEVRDHSDLIVVIGDDAIFENCPRMATALSGPNVSEQSVLLLGNFSQGAFNDWTEAGFEAWSIPCQVSDVPKALSQWFRKACAGYQSNSSDPSILNDDDADPSEGCIEPLFRKMANAGYTTFIWSAQNLNMINADLWVERMMQFIAGRNETHRCAGLPWGAQDGTFQQVCTWLTGFPGRIAFQNGTPIYDPIENCAERWIKKAASNASVKSLVIHVDETAEETSRWPFDREEIPSNIGRIDISRSSRDFPTLVAGAEFAADMFRADQTVLAHVKPIQEPKSTKARSAAHWLEFLGS